MYKLLIILIVFHSVILSQPQFPTEPLNDTTFYVATEIMPEPEGGISGIQSKVHYTQEAINAEIEGKVYVLAYIDEAGIVVRTKVIKGLGYGLDEAASDGVLQTKFSPGMHRDKPIKMQVAIPIVFKLE
jgi:periplasmic protein TonB